MTYHLSYEASLGELKFNDSGALPRRVVSLSAEIWSLIPQKRFELSQQSRLNQSAGTKTLSSLFETAHGSCREQR